MLLRRSGQPWYADAVAQAFRSSSKARRLADSDAEWRGYLMACAADGTSPLPITLDSVEAWWAYRVIGCGLKSAALKSATSRLLTHAVLLGYKASTSVIGAVREEHIRCRAGFPCEVLSGQHRFGQPHGSHRVRRSKSERKLLLPLPVHAPSDRTGAVLPAHGLC